MVTTYSLALLPSAFGALEGRTEELTEEQLAALFSTYTVSVSKDGPAFIPAKMRPCPAGACIGKTATDCGGGAFHRLDENVESLTGLMIDSDAGDVDSVLKGLVADGLTHFVWQTYSHTSETPKHRVFVPFHAPLPIRSKQQWAQVFWPALIRSRGLDPDKAASIDKKCRNAGRLYYAPSKPPGGQQQAWVHWGNALDWSTVAGISLDSVPLVEPLSASYRDPPRPPGEFYVDVEGLRTRLRAVRGDAETRGVINALADGKALCPPPSERKRGDLRKRRSSWLMATCWLANCAQGNETAEELLQAVALPSFEAEVKDDPEEHTRWADIEKMLDGAMGDATEHRAREAHRRELKAFSEKVARAGVSRTPASGEAEEPDPDYWRTQVVMGKDRNGETIVTPTIDNIGPILLHHPVWRGSFKFNAYKQTVEIWGGPLLEGAKPRNVKDSDCTHVATWFARQFKFKLSPPTYWDHLISSAEACTYHPVKDYLAECKAGGSKSPGILNRWLFEFCAVSTDGEGRPPKELVSVYGRKFLISCVARVMRPGCKVDTMPVFVGEQGARKSTLLSVLADNGRFFTDAAITFDGSQNSSMIISTNWIVEAPELEGLARVTVKQMRATLSRAVDTFRPPYGRSIVDFPRSSVFGGTTNEAEFLLDSAGNRRFWVIPTGAIDIGGLSEVVPSLWAEAVAAYEAGEQWWLTAEEQALSNTSNETHMVTDQLAEKIKDCVRKDRQRKDFYSTTDILNMLELPAHQAHSAKVSSAMRRAGFAAARRCRGSERVRGYLTPQWLIEPLQVVK